MKTKYFIYTLITAYLITLLYYIISLYTIVNRLPLNNIMAFINHLNSTLDVDKILNTTFSKLYNDIDYFKDNLVKIQNINQTLFEMFDSFNSRLMSIENDVNVIKGNTQPEY